MFNEKKSFSITAAKLAVHSLIEEVELTPKPGLVDKRNNGAHHDITLQLMRISAESLTETFEKIAFISYGRSPSQSLREEIAEIGRAGEKRMFEVTFGVNTHKGAIWAIGLLVSSTSMGKGMYNIEEIVTLAGELARFTDRYCPETITNGSNVTTKYGVGGARGEAQQGFPNIMNFSLPMLNRSRESGYTEEEARLNALLSLIAQLDDTCILHRQGLEALSFAKHQAHYLLTNGNLDWLNTLDETFTKRNISPGGSADLLAATLFLDKIQANKTEKITRKDYVYTN
ncbi:triphosphoribosyl-dephospho-CoA synthase [Paenisporosarcina antarctica]|uniref:triphosphoribosyl-dephospho-CoA synthase n=1 Tax=Paenisporosarcina antarctica TaxID=417367 RepID=A0A4P6ZXD0_9BACL|nr:triphosphoribosyl-dephospho-CoA synthase [Paenisporosarcina antarctica]QBP40166.1 triphosphoribosyl-dephospho-CoA synthase [Paenisporosarcina antarctica]